jgi:hypothetical protein
MCYHFDSRFSPGFARVSWSGDLGEVVVVLLRVCESVVEVRGGWSGREL